MKKELKINKIFAWNVLLGIYILIFMCMYPAFTILNGIFVILIGGVLIGENILKKDILFYGFREILIVLTTTVYGYELGMYPYILYASLIWILFYLVGKSTVWHSDKNTEHYLASIILVLVFGFFIHAMGSFYWYIVYGNHESRWWNDFFVGAPLPATQHSFFVFPILALLFPAIIHIRKYKLLCSSVIFANIICVVYAAMTSSRSQFALIAVMFAWEMLLYLGINRKDKKKVKIAFYILLAIVLVVLAAVGVLILAIKNRWFGIDDAWIGKLMWTLKRDGGILNNDRFRAQRSAIIQVFTHPNGNFDLEEFGMGFVHNTWLDIANFGGIWPFIIFTVYTCFSLYDMGRLIFNKNVSSELKYVVSGVYWALMLYYFIEPALWSNFYYFVPWLFINGMVYELLRRDSRNEKSA